MKETAAASAAFIFLNSAAGLTGHVTAGMEVSPNIALWIAVVAAGGLLGSWTGGFKISAANLRYLITAVLLIACIKLFIM
jgi:hypothetical protein